MLLSLYPPPLPCPGTSGWLLDSVFKPKSAAELGLVFAHHHEQPCTVEVVPRNQGLVLAQGGS